MVSCTIICYKCHVYIQLYKLCMMCILFVWILTALCVWASDECMYTHVYSMASIQG